VQMLDNKGVEAIVEEMNWQLLIVNG
jgi:hypothetical protein